MTVLDKNDGVKLLFSVFLLNEELEILYTGIGFRLVWAHWKVMV
jgi:hypothetical protein